MRTHNRSAEEEIEFATLGLISLTQKELDNKAEDIERIRSVLKSSRSSAEFRCLLKMSVAQMATMKINVEMLRGVSGASQARSLFVAKILLEHAVQEFHRYQDLLNDGARLSDGAAKRLDAFDIQGSNMVLAARKILMESKIGDFGLFLDFD